MTSTKASALDEEATRRGFGLLRFDYSGHGLSGGRIEDGTISRWLEESLAVFRAQSEGPQILVGSSMGGYLALLVARALHEAGEDKRLAGMILIAPAVDMTEALMWAHLPDEARRAIAEVGAWARPTAYAPEPYVITRGLIEDGRRHLLLDGVVRTYCPVSILQAMRDEDVPYKHALALMERLVADSATLTLVRDGDHRLSRPQDIALLIETLGRHLA
jgi:pimeloyl-ACP methyl ester carboxylesterase